MQIAGAVRTTAGKTSIPIRFHGLDALRGIGAILVVLLHAGIPYMTWPLPYLAWPARDPHPSSAVNFVTWGTECFIMPLFFVLAGFFSNGLLMSKGERRFLEGRTKRLFSTQCLASIVILPICLAVWLLGWMADGLFIPCIGGLPRELKAGLFGVAHLWFLQDLYIYCLLLCGGSYLMKRFVGPNASHRVYSCPLVRCLGSLLISLWKPVLPAIPCAFILYWDTRIVLGFYHSFLPVLSKLTYYAVYFFVGAIVHRQRDNLHLHARFGKRYLLISGALFCTALPMIHQHLAIPLTGLPLAFLASLISLFAWSATFGLFAIFLRAEHCQSAVMSYLSEASFWIYLIHLPFVVLTQIAVAQSPIPTVGKYLLAGSTSLALSLMTYHVFVKDRWLGALLNGRSGAGKRAAEDSEAIISKFPAAATTYADPNRVSRSA